MAGAYSADLRARVIDAIAAGGSRRAVARVFRVSASSAIRWAQRVRDSGSFAAKPTGGDVRSHGIEAHKDWLLALIAAEPDLTLEEIRGRLTVEKSFKASVSVVWRFFRRHGISFKKRMARPVCNGGIGWRVGLHQRIRSQSVVSGQDGFRAFQAS
jgi:transposase